LEKRVVKREWVTHPLDYQRVMKENAMKISLSPAQRMSIPTLIYILLVLGQKCSYADKQKIERDINLPRSIDWV
jgi:hypothetical protein